MASDFNFLCRNNFRFIGELQIQRVPIIHNILYCFSCFTLLRDFACDVGDHSPPQGSAIASLGQPQPPAIYWSVNGRVPTCRLWEQGGLLGFLILKDKVPVLPLNMVVSRCIPGTAAASCNPRPAAGRANRGRRTSKYTAGRNGLHDPASGSVR